MNLSHAYGAPPSAEDARRVLLRALELGVTHFDTATLYGFGANEELVGNVLGPYRSRFTLASKGGVFGIKTESGFKRVIDGRPESLRANCEASLRNLRTDVIDLYYLHRWDKRLPIEDSVGTLAMLAKEGKIRQIGLSEVSASTLRRAQRVHPIAAVQSEYSAMTRNPEIGVLEVCRESGIAFIAFSPVGRGMFSLEPIDVRSFEANDIRRAMPRFEVAHYAANQETLKPLRALAAELGHSPAQLALAWLLRRGDNVLAIPGTTQLSHLQENIDAGDLQLNEEAQKRLDAVVESIQPAGNRYSLATQAEIDTEEWPS